MARRNEQPEEASLLPEPVPAVTESEDAPVPVPVYVEPERKRGKSYRRPTDRELGTRLVAAGEPDDATPSLLRRALPFVVLLLLLGLGAFLILQL